MCFNNVVYTDCTSEKLFLQHLAELSQLETDMIQNSFICLWLIRCIWIDCITKIVCGGND